MTQPTFSIPRLDLLRALRTLKPLTPSRTNIPILQHALITGRDDAVTIEATDLDTVLRLHLPDAKGRGTLTLDLSAGIKLADLADDAMTWITATPELAEAESAQMKCGDMTAEIRSLPAADYPALPREDAPKTPPGMYALPAQDLRAALQFVAHASSKDETRYYLRGVYFHLNAAGQLALVATDGHRMGLAHVSAADRQQDWTTGGLIMPTDAVSLLLQMLKNEKGTVRITFGTRTMEILAMDWTLWTKTIDGTFPDYTRVVPERTRAAARLMCHDIQTKARRLERAVDARDVAAALDLPGNTISATNDGRKIVLRTDFAHPAFDIPAVVTGINAAYLADMTRELGALCDSARFYVRGLGDPMRMEPETQPHWGEALGIVMPMRV